MLLLFSSKYGNVINIMSTDSIHEKLAALVPDQLAKSHPRPEDPAASRGLTALGDLSSAQIIELPGTDTLHSVPEADPDNETERRQLAEEVAGIADKASRVFEEMLLAAGMKPDERTMALVNHVMTAQGYELGYKGLAVGPEDLRDFARHTDPSIPTTAEQAELEKNATTDPLTGLLNRRGFDEAIKGKNVVAIIGGDVRNLKAANDGIGMRHSDGDDLIKQSAESIRTSVRETDVVARFGGDEFVVALIEEPPHDQAETQLNRRSDHNPKDPDEITQTIIQKIKLALDGRLRKPEYIRIGNVIQYKNKDGTIDDIRVGLDLGMIQVADGGNVDEAIEEAMINMKQAKKEGRTGENGSGTVR